MTAMKIVSMLLISARAAVLLLDWAMMAGTDSVEIVQINNESTVNNYYENRGPLRTDSFL